MLSSVLSLPCTLGSALLHHLQTLESDLDESALSTLAMNLVPCVITEMTSLTSSHYRNTVGMTRSPTVAKEHSWKRLKSLIMIKTMRHMHKHKQTAIILITFKKFLQCLLTMLS